MKGQFRNNTLLNQVEEVVNVVETLYSIKSNLSFSNPEQFAEILCIGPPIRQEDPLNLSILISGGKETNQDSLSNGE